MQRTNQWIDPGAGNWPPGSQLVLGGSSRCSWPSHTGNDLQFPTRTQMLIPDNVASNHVRRNRRIPHFGNTFHPEGVQWLYIGMWYPWQRYLRSGRRQRSMIVHQWVYSFECNADSVQYSLQAYQYGCILLMDCIYGQ